MGRVRDLAMDTHLDQVQADDGGAESLQTRHKVERGRCREGAGTVDWRGRGKLWLSRRRHVLD